MVELAGLEIGSNHLDEALSLAKRAIALEPNNARAHDAMGHALLASDRLNESAHELEIAKRLAPASADIRSHLAMVYGRLGRSREARTEAALSLSLKKKEDVLVPPQEKLKIVEQAEKP
jgi:predicted Zn-dependent protease